MRPYIICHTFSSLDGKIKQTIWGLKDHHKYFEEPAAKIKADAWIVGRVTMQEFCSKKKHDLSKYKGSVPRTDFVAPRKTETFAVAIDPSGKCFWDTNMVTTEQVIEVLTQQVPDSYLLHLRSKNVSYIFAGKKEIDLKLAMEKLHKLFNIKAARVDGGGHVNGAFLKAGLIDELSIVLAPLADGTTGSLSMFEAQTGYGKRMATHFALKSVKKIYNNFLWLRYRVKK